MLGSCLETPERGADAVARMWNTLASIPRLFLGIYSTHDIHNLQDKTLLDSLTSRHHIRLKTLTLTTPNIHGLAIHDVHVYVDTRIERVHI